MRPLNKNRDITLAGFSWLKQFVDPRNYYCAKYVGDNKKWYPAQTNLREPYYNGYIEHLGCTAQQFRAWISAQFTKGMKWKNYGRYDPKRKTWSLDHLCPLSRAEGDIEKLIPLLHFKNIRPFDSRENLIERGR